MKRVNKNRLGTFLPRVEVLENRWQPGSLLTSGLDLAVLGSALDQNLGSADHSSTSNQALNLSLGSFQNHQNTGGTVAVTPYQVSHTNNAGNTSLTLSTGTSTQGLENTQALAGAARQTSSAQGATTHAAGSVQGNTVNLHQQGGQQTAQSGVTATATPVGPAAPVTPTAAPAPVTIQPINLQLTKATAGDGHHPPTTGYAASLFATNNLLGPSTTALYKEVTDGSGAIWAVGETTDPGGGAQDGVIVATDNFYSSANVAFVSSAAIGGSGNAAILSVDLDSTGNLIIGGYISDANGNQNGLIASVTPDLTTLNWGFTIGGSLAPASINGVNDAGGHVGQGYARVTMTGYVTDASGQQDLLVGQSDEQGNFSFAFYYTFSIPTAGNAVGVDTNTGNIDVAGALAVTQSSNPGFFDVAPDGSSVTGYYYNSLGSMNAVNVDGAGDAYYAGSFQNPTALVNSDLVAEIAPDGATQIYGFYWTFSINGVPGNSPAYDSKIDAAGDQFQELTFDDNTGNPNTHGHLVFIVDSTGGNYIDFGDGGINGSNDDFGYGIAIDNNGANVYEVGKTDSTDFTTNGFQTAYNPGDPFEGWLGSSTEP